MGILNQMKEQLKSQGGNGYHNLRKKFHSMDADGNGVLSMGELKQALKNMNISISDREVRLVFEFFDLDQSRSISFEEFIDGVRDPLNDVRNESLETVFNFLDKDGDGDITVEELLQLYDVSHHPDVVSGSRSEREVLEELVGHFEIGGVADGKIQKNEFFNYYSNVGVGIRSDDDFNKLLSSTWALPPEVLDSDKRHVIPPKFVAHTYNPNASSRNAAVAIFGGGEREQPTKDFVDDLGMTKTQHKHYRHQAARNASHFVIAGGRPDVPKGLAKPTSRAQMSSLAGGVLKKELASDVYDVFNRKLYSAKPLSLDKAKDGKRVVYQDGIDLLLTSLRKQLASKGASGIIGLSRSFKEMDDDGNHSLDPREFKKAVAQCGLQMNDESINSLFVYMDTDGSGSISFEEFIKAMKGDLSPHRKQLIDLAFNKLDIHGDGIIDPSDVMNTYDASQHPDVIAGHRTPDEVLQEFLNTFDVGGEVDGKVTRKEFENYYHSLSASIDNDDYFELMMRNAWHISGGEGWAANTANRRVLVTKADGTQSVEEIKDDLGVDDRAAMLARLRRQNMSFNSSGISLSLFGGGEYGSNGSQPSQIKSTKTANNNTRSQI